MPRPLAALSQRRDLFGAAAPTAVAPARQSPMLTIEELHDGVCKWPLSPEVERAVFLYCGERASVSPSGKQRPYCACHAAIAYRPASGSDRADERDARRVERADANLLTQRRSIEACAVVARRD